MMIDKDAKSIQDIKERFLTNLNGYVSEFRIWLILVLVTGTADMISTIYFMVELGAEHEVHPAVRIVCTLFGPYIGPVIGKLCQYVAVFGITVFFRRQAIFVFLSVIILYGWAAWYNIWGSNLYYPRLLRFIDYFSYSY